MLNFHGLLFLFGTPVFARLSLLTVLFLTKSSVLLMNFSVKAHIMRSFATFFTDFHYFKQWNSQNHQDLCSFFGISEDNLLLVQLDSTWSHPCQFWQPLWSFRFFALSQWYAASISRARIAYSWILFPALAWCFSEGVNQGLF